MSPEAIALANVLLDHHNRVCRGSKGTSVTVDSSVVTYGALCEMAGVKFLARSTGPFLQEVAEWCHTNGWPPINSLVINQQLRRPGDGYDDAAGCSLANWNAEVHQCIAFKKYPDRAA